MDTPAIRAPEGDSRDTGWLGVTVRRPVGVLMVTLAVCLFGWTSFGRLPLNLLPDLSYPTLTVRTTWEGAAPEEVEERVTRPLEEGLRMVPGLAEATSVSRAGTSSITLRFGWGTDMRFAAQDVAERIQQSRNQLPEDASQPLVLRYDPTLEPVLRIAVVGQKPIGELRRYAEDELGRALEKLEGVAAAKVEGGVEEEVHIDLSEDLLAANGLSVQDISRRLAEENIDIAAGSLLDGDTEYLVRTQNRLRSLADLGELVVTRRGEATVRLRDVGRVRPGARERDVLLRVDGDEGVLVEIHREAGANLVEVARRVRDAAFGTDEQRAYVEQHRERLLAERRSGGPQGGGDERAGGQGGGGGRRGPGGAVRGPGAGGQRSGGGRGDDDPAAEQRRLDRRMTEFLAYDAPAGVRPVLLDDSSVFVEHALDEVNGAVWQGGLLAVGLLFLFLRQARPTLIIAVSLPTSVVFTFAAMFLFDTSLNLMSLGGLALGIGMLVDNSIVVLESIVRCREEGSGIVAATLRGTRQVAGAVVASTLTTVAVFLPIVFVEGIAGQVFRDQALTVVLSLMASLAAALFLIPMLASRELPDRSGERGGTGQRPRPWTFPATRRRAAEVRWGSWRARAISLVGLPFAAAFELVGVVLYVPFVLLVGRLGGLALRQGGRLQRLLLPITWPFDKAYQALERAYEAVASTALRRRGLTLACVAGAAVYAALLYPRLGGELFPRIHQGTFTVEVRLPVTTPVEETDRLLASVTPALRAVPGVAQVTAVAGVARDDVEAADEGPHTGELRVALAPTHQSAEAEERVVDAVRAVLAARPELNLPRIAFPELVSLSSTLDVEITDEDLPRLRRSAAAAGAALAEVDGLADVSTGLERGNPEVVLDLEPETLARYGLTRRQVAEAVRAKVQGERPTRLLATRRLEVRVALDKDDIPGIEGLKRIQIGTAQAASGGTARAGAASGAGGAGGAAGQVASLTGGAAGGSASGASGGSGAGAGASSGGVGGGVGSDGAASGRPVLLGDVAQVRVIDGPSEIIRVQGRRVHRLRANLEGDIDIAGASARAEDALAKALGPLVDFRVVGQSEEMQRSERSLLYALITAAFLVYVVMASQFESLLQPFIIILTVPLAAIGVLTALFAVGQPVGVVVYIGAIVLAGVVVNNAIVLIDTANQLRDEGATPAEAVQRAGQLRLRPILMTTATTVLGLLPMLLSSGAGAEIRRPLALTVAAGLVASTVLTLVVIPVVYAVVEERLARGRAAETEA